jgi:outer membrane protein assembly complex protein YaeT
MRWLIAFFILATFGSPVFGAEQGVNTALAGADIVLDTLKNAERSKVQFSGHTTFKDEELRTAIGEQIREIDENGVTPARSDDAAYYVGAFYRKSGFAKVDTTYAINGPRVTIKIVEGPRSLLRKVTFTGNHAIPSTQLYQYMIGATPERMEKRPEDFPYNASEIASGADRVRGFYVSEGYLDAVVDASSVTVSAGGTRAEVLVKIEEHERYTFGDITFAGETIFPREVLLKALAEPVDGPFSRTKVTNTTRNLQSFYKAHGYYTAEVTVEADPKLAVNGRVAVKYTATPRDIFRFGGVRVENQTKPKPRLQESFLPRRFAHLAGETYDPAMLDETFREMLRTGLFTTLRLNPVALPDDTVRLDFTVEEAKAKEVGFTLGYGTYNGATAGVRLADRDLFGRGRPLSLSIDYTQRGLSGELLYVDPWLFETQFNFRARLFSAVREEEGYSKNELGARVDVGHRLFKRVEVAVFVQGETVTVSDASIDPALLGPTDYTLTSVGFTQTTDYRDNPINPTRGWVFTSSFDVADIDGEAGFLRGTARFSIYQPIGRKCLLALGARVGGLKPIAPSIPIDTRFFNGGGTTVRSFSERQLGPKDKQDNPLGGEFYTVLNAEFTFPIYRGFEGAVFVDAGNLTDWSNVGFSDMRYAVGVGLRYKLPVGPLRLDYGLNPSPRSNEEMGAFHFSFGFAF